MSTANKSTVTTLPAIAMRGIVMFPSMILHFDVGREKSILAIKEAMKKDQLILFGRPKRLHCRRASKRGSL